MLCKAVQAAVCALQSSHWLWVMHAMSPSAAGKQLQAWASISCLSLSLPALVPASIGWVGPSALPSTSVLIGCTGAEVSGRSCTEAAQSAYVGRGRWLLLPMPAVQSPASLSRMRVEASGLALAMFSLRAGMLKSSLLRPPLPPACLLAGCKHQRSVQAGP